MERPMLVWLRTELVQADQLFDQAVAEDKDLRHRADRARERWQALQRRLNALRELAATEGIDVDKLLAEVKPEPQLNDPAGPFADVDDQLDTLEIEGGQY